MPYVTTLPVTYLTAESAWLNGQIFGDTDWTPIGGSGAFILNGGIYTDYVIDPLDPNNPFGNDLGLMGIPLEPDMDYSYVAVGECYKNIDPSIAQVYYGSSVGFHTPVVEIALSNQKVIDNGNNSYSIDFDYVIKGSLVGKSFYTEFELWLDPGSVYGFAVTSGTVHWDAPQELTGHITVNITTDGTLPLWYSFIAVDSPDNINATSRLFPFTFINPLSTDDATNIATTSATLNGELFRDVETCHFEWDTEAYYNEAGVFRYVTPSRAVTAGLFNQALSELTPNILYAFQAVAESDGYEGGVVTFQTLSESVIATDDATNITGASATLNGELFRDVETCHFEWDTQDYYNATGVFRHVTPSIHVTAGLFHQDISGLPAASTTYAFQAIAESDGSKGGVLTFQTLSGSGTIATLAAKYINQTSAYVGGKYTTVNTPAQAGIQFKTGNTWQTVFWWAQDPFYISMSTDFWWNKQGLYAGHTYTYRAFIIIDGVYSYGSELSFTTPVYPVINLLGLNYLTARQAIDSVQTTCLGRTYSDEQGNLVYQSRNARG